MADRRAGRFVTSRKGCGRLGLAALGWLGLGLAAASASDEARVNAAPTAEAIRGAMGRGLVRVEQAARNYPDHRDCFSCHHQTLPILAMTTARAAGARIDEGLLEETVVFSAESFRQRIKRLERGSGIGGGAMTVGYGLWAFEEAERKPDELTDAMVTFLLKNQEGDGSWRRGTLRPPLEESHVTCTALAAAGLKRGAPLRLRAASREAIERAKDWLADAAPAESQEDRNARLWGLWKLGSDPTALEAARAAVLETQRADGGWAQADSMESDAYATGQALAVLAWSGLPTDDPAYQKGLAFLIETQCGDGSWKVETRSRPIQVFFDNGDPHGKSQFISTSATCWAVTALALGLEADGDR